MDNQTASKIVACLNTQAERGVHRKNRHVTGVIKIGDKLVAVEVIRRNQTGSKLVRLLADCGAYRIGDKVNVGPGQFIKDE